MEHSIEELQRRNRTITIIALLIIYAALAAKPIWQSISAHKQASAKPPIGQFIMFNWKHAEQVTWHGKQVPIYPKKMAVLQGKRVRVQGFILSIKSKSSSSIQLLLVPQPRECYAGLPPPLTESVLLHLHDCRQSTTTTEHIWAYGVLSLAMDSIQGSEALYTLNNTVIVTGSP